MIKNFNFIILLFCIIFVLFIKLSSAFEIIIDSNNNTPGSSISIPVALNNFKNYLNTLSIKNYTLELKLVDGIYEADLNAFTYFGWNLIISPYSFGSKNVIIDGSKITNSNSLITINNDVEYNGLKNTILTTSNINFQNFNTTLLSSSSTIKNDQSVKIKFDTCQFSKCFKGFSIGLSADSTKNVNSIIISNTNFENVSFVSSLFKFRNFNLQIVSSDFNSISGGGVFVDLIDSSLTIDSSKFKEFIVLSDFITTYYNGAISIKDSDNWKFIALSFVSSNAVLDSNTITYSNPNNNSLVSCSGDSIVEFNNNIGDSISHKPICTLCNFIYNGNKLCSIASSTTTIIGTTSTTTGEHTNGSINIKPLSHHLFFILLVLITLLKF
ncbi:hypothetical protein ACTFIY_008704 [Dictyostelium cf. discoideum]